MYLNNPESCYWRKNFALIYVIVLSDCSVLRYTWKEVSVKISLNMSRWYANLHVKLIHDISVIKWPHSFEWCCVILLGLIFGAHMVIGELFLSDFKGMAEISVKQNQICRSYKKYSWNNISICYKTDSVCWYLPYSVMNQISDRDMVQIVRSFSMVAGLLLSVLNDVYLGLCSL